MGNFAFDWERMRNRNLDGLAVYCTIRGRRLADVAFSPARRNSENFIELLHANRGEGGKIVERVRSLSAEARTEIILEDGVAIVRGLKVSA
jgi:hypothetical protein